MRKMAVFMHFQMPFQSLFASPQKETEPSVMINDTEQQYTNK